ncbi:MAG: hypothetical protein AB7F49_24110 [Pseudorhodoplanes sp.]
MNLGRTLVPLALLFVASPTLAAPKKPEQVVACTGPFAKGVTHASLVKAFGANNVAVQRVGTGEGETQVASVIFPRDKARRIEVLWIDETRLRRASEIRTGVESQWRTEHGIRRGMTLAEIEALNGRPFRLYGFGFDYGGTTLDWNGGALDKQAGGCTLTLRFMMREGADNAAVHGGEQDFMSDSEAMRKAAPVVDAVGLRFGE